MCKAMSETKLRDTIRIEEPRVKVLSSLVECAKWELRKRLSNKRREEEAVEAAKPSDEEE